LNKLVVVLGSDESFKLVEVNLISMARVDVLELNSGIVLTHVHTTTIVEAC